MENDDRVLQLARDMASYVHHSGYPQYDGGHSEPEETCAHEDCAAVRAAMAPKPDQSIDLGAAPPRADRTPLNKRTLGDILREAIPTAVVQILSECLVGASLRRSAKKRKTPDVTEIRFVTNEITPTQLMNGTTPVVGVVVWVPREIWLNTQKTEEKP